MIYGLILAGGSGERLYPLSRINRPKQFLNLVNGNTFLYNTICRVSNIISKENLYVTTNVNYLKYVIEESKGIVNQENIISEPLNKETAVCIALASIKILKKDRNAVVLVFPSDHYIEMNQGFYDILNYVGDICVKKNGILMIGVKPKKPKTCYGYIHLSDKFKSINTNQYIYKVDKFIEKPDYQLAESMLMNGKYLWNSGIFCFRADVYLREVKIYLPEIYQGMCKIYKSLGNNDEEDVIKNVYKDIEGISIDYGIMNKSNNLYAIVANFYWDDMGSFDSLYKILSRSGENLSGRNVVLRESENCIVFGDDNLVLAFGLKNLIIVNTGDVTLIMDKYRENEIKDLFKLLKNEDKFEKFI